MFYDKRLVLYYLCFLAFAGLMTISWLYVRPKDDVFFVLGYLTSVCGIIVTATRVYRRGRNDESAKVADETIKGFLRRAREKSLSSNVSKGTKIPVLHRSLRWNPEIHIHLKPVIKAKQGQST